MPPPLACNALSCRREQWNENGPSAIASVNAAFQSGTVNGFCGPDGSGKGLLLNVLGLLEPPDAGEILLQGKTIAGAPDESTRQMRNETFGFLFNHPCLLPSFSVAENVAMPLFRICGGDAQAARVRTLDVLEFCGIADRECTLAGRLDLPSQRRTALARALVHGPKILIAVSPRDCGSLLQIARKAAEDLGVTVLWSGAEDDLVPYADRIFAMNEGRIISDRNL
jgi:ABC-type lipoprotein export system ATPase subunit